MIEKIEHYSLTDYASVYDEEGMTALELAGRTAGKVNEVVDGFNTVIREIPGQLAKEVQKHIDKGEFDTQINEYIGDLEGRVENLLGSVDEGSTTFDAEIIDGRHGADGVNYSSLGTAIREQFKNSSGWRTSTTKDANDVKDIGFYFVGSADGWKNVPSEAGLLLVYYGNVMTRLYQIFISYIDGAIYTRTHTGTAFKSWTNTNATGLDNIKNELNNNTLKLKLDLANGSITDANDVNSTGFYSFGSGQTVANLPSGVNAGMLYAFKGTNPSLIYQVLFSYAGDIYHRNCDTTGTFNDWKKVGAPDGSNTATVNSASLFQLYIENDSIVIHRKTPKGYVKFTLAPTNEYWRITRCDVCNDSKQVVKTVFTEGHDVDGVVKINGTYYGGAHGSEIGHMFNLIAGGYYITEFDFPNYQGELINCDSLTIITSSAIQIFDEELDDFYINIDRNKKIEFNSDGVHITNEFVHAGYYETFDWISGAMMSVNNECFSHYIYGTSEDSSIHCKYIRHEPYHVNRTIDIGNTRDITYTGKGIEIRHWTEDFDSDTSETLFQDYTDRLKTYFNTHIGTQFGETTEEIITHNHFNVIY